MLKLPLGLARRALKEAGAKRISKFAEIELAKVVKQSLFKISKLAIKNAEYSGRKGVKAEDIKKAVKELQENM